MSYFSDLANTGTSLATEVIKDELGLNQQPPAKQDPAQTRPPAVQAAAEKPAFKPTKKHYIIGGTILVIGGIGLFFVRKK